MYTRRKRLSRCRPRTSVDIMRLPTSQAYFSIDLASQVSRMTSDVKRWPGQTGESHPEVFTEAAMPPPPAVRKLGQLPDAQIRQFFEEGYLILDSFFDMVKLDRCLKAVEGLVDWLANLLYDGGKISDLYKDYGVLQRLTKLEEAWPGANILLIKSGKMPEAFRELWSDPRLLNVAEQVLGPDLVGHPVWNLRCKVPQNEATVVPWHQDAAYMENTAYSVLQLTAWIPLVAAGRENGCMEVVRGGHRAGKVATHTCCWKDTWYVELAEEVMVGSLGVDMHRDVKLCPVPRGGLLLLNNLIPHRSLPNVSDGIRWSLDLRWTGAGNPLGFWGLKDGVAMRDSRRPGLLPDWDTFVKVDRNAEEEKKSAKATDGDATFDTTVHGPWMKKWELTNTNRHTQRLLGDVTV